MTTAEQAAQSEAARAHRTFMDHVRTCKHCRYAYPWCGRGTRLERLADSASARSVAYLAEWECTQSVAYVTQRGNR